MIVSWNSLRSLTQIVPVCGSSLRFFRPSACVAVRYDDFLKWDKIERMAVREEDVMKSEGHYQPMLKGRIYDKKPFKFTMEKGRRYSWCACGYSKSQPFCDGSHKQPWINSPLLPLKFIAKEEKDVWFCNCKQTNNKPFCDNACKDAHVQDVKLF